MCNRMTSFVHLSDSWWQRRRSSLRLQATQFNCQVYFCLRMNETAERWDR